jgi:hypothetical protein
MTLIAADASSVVRSSRRSSFSRRLLNVVISPAPENS